MPLRRLPKALLHVQLTRHTTPGHYLAFLLASLVLISQFVFANSTQPYLLTEFFHVPPSKAGQWNAWLLLADQLISVAMLGIWGSLSDRYFGRRWLFVSGFLLMATSFWLFSWLVIYEVYMLIMMCRLVFAVGAAAASSMIASTMADYVREKDKAKVSGTLGLVTGLGAMLGAFVFIAMPSHLTSWFAIPLALALQLSYVVCGGVCFITAIVLMLGLKPDHPALLRRHYQLLEDDSDTEVESPISPDDQSVLNNDEQHQRISPLRSPAEESTSTAKTVLRNVSPISSTGSRSIVRPKPRPMQVSPAEVCPFVNVEAIAHQQVRKSFWRLAYEGLMLARNPVILLAYLSGFIARGDSAIITLFVSLWVDTYFVEHGLCPEDPAAGAFSTEDPLKKGSCPAAIRRAYMLSGIAQSAVLFGAPIFALISHKLKHTPALLVATLTSMVGYIAFALLPSPLHPLAFLAATVAGLGEIGVIISSLRTCASNELVPKALRGSVGGCYSVFGALGLLLSTQIGGILFDQWWHGSPFFIMGILSAFVSVGCIVVMVLNRVATTSADHSTENSSSD